MLARIPFGVPAWELAVSIALLMGTFVLCGWASAKIYKIGILMFGKKTTLSDSSMSTTLEKNEQITINKVIYKKECI